ncbi:MAG: PDC sensor domain-containing protein, partial [Desulfobacterales bacterium]|nr:PDC sensor domain-containing protein [Desulfobacterales bacterium]
EVSPDIKKEVEQKLSLLANEISQKKLMDNETAFAMLSDYLSKNSKIYGAAFAFAPQKKDGKVIKSSPYIYRSGENLIKKNLIESYDYTKSNHKWYVTPVKKSKAVWSEPYYDEGGGNAWMITYSIPIYSSGKNPHLIGVVTSDVFLSEQ